MTLHSHPALRAAVVAGFGASCLLAGFSPASAADDPTYDPVADCQYWRPGGAQFAYSATAYVATEHAASLTSLRITCVYETWDHTYWTTDVTRAPLVPVVNASGYGPLKGGTTYVCGVAVATYADGHTGTGHTGDTPRLCPATP